MALLILVFVQEKWRPFELKPLDGVTVETKMPDITLSNFTSGNLQRDLEQYSKEHFGFREWLIRGYNQYLWDAYRKTHVERVVCGKDGFLYKKNYVDDYEGKGWREAAETQEQLHEQLRQEALRLYKLQEILEENGKHLFVVIEPSKANVEPEHLPDWVTATNDNLTAADIYPTLFDSLGVHYIDFNRFFQQTRDALPYKPFPPTGTHWSNIAALHAADSIIRYMAWLGNCKLPTLAISETLFDTVMTPDYDLEELLNLVRPIRHVTNQYADFKIVADSNTVKPALLTVGDSYYWNLSYHIPMDSLFSKHPFWYYNNTVFYDPDHQSTNDLNYTQQLINTDFVMVSYCTSNLYSMSNLFSSKALVNLCYDKTEINNAIDQLITEIENNPEWKALIQQKAEAEGCSLDDKIRKEAEYFVYANAERYFPAINDDHPAQRNQMLSLCQPGNPVGDILRNMINDPTWMDHLKQKAEQNHLDLETVMIQDAQWMLNQTTQNP